MGREKTKVGRGANGTNERGKRLPLLLEASSGNSRVQTLLLDVLQRVAVPQVDYPEAPTAHIFISLQNSISKFGWRMVKLLLEGGPNHGPMKGTEVFKRSLAECSRLHETQRRLENMTEGKCFPVQEHEDVGQLYQV